MTLAAPIVDESWHTLTVTAQTDAEARKAAADCARAINTAGVTSLRVRTYRSVCHLTLAVLRYASCHV